MRWLSKETKCLLAEMAAGTIFYNLVLALLAAVLLQKSSYPLLPVLFGLLAGGIAAILMMVHMAIMTERVLETQNEEYANKTTVMHSLLRKLVFLAFMFLCWRVLNANPLALVIGAMGMKAGAYLQPVFHRLCVAVIMKERRENT